MSGTLQSLKSLPVPMICQALCQMIEFHPYILVCIFQNTQMWWYLWTCSSCLPSGEVPGLRISPSDVSYQSFNCRGCIPLQADFTLPSVQETIRKLLPTGQADTGVCRSLFAVHSSQWSCWDFHAVPLPVLSDMAHNFMGISTLDHERQLHLAQDALKFSQLVKASCHSLKCLVPIPVESGMVCRCCGLAETAC